jgi:hypothetical protein
MPDIERRPQHSQAKRFNIANRGRKVGHARAATTTDTGATRGMAGSPAATLTQYKKSRRQ